MNEQLVIEIKAEIADMKKQLDEAKSEIKKMAQETEKSTAEMDERFQKIGDSIKNGLKTAATIGVGAIAALGTALISTVGATEEYRNAQSKLVSAFQTAGSSAAQATTTYNDLYRVLGDGDVAVEAANHLAKLTTEEQALSEWTNICQGIYATFGDSLPIEGLTEAANETAKVGQLTGGLADALNWAGVNEEEFQSKLDACSTEAEREALIRGTLNGLYNEAASNYEKNAAGLLAQNEAQAQLDASLAALGETLQPVITDFKALAADALAAVLPYVQDFATNHLPVLKDLLGEVASALETAFTWISQNKEVLAVMAGIIAGIAAAIGLYNAVAAIKAAMDAAQVATLGALVAAQLASAAATVVALAPYLAIVAAIAAVIAIIVICVKHWDEIKEACAKAFAKIKEVVSNAIDAVVNFFKKMIDWVKENWQGLLLLILNPFAGAFKIAYDNCEGFRNKVNSFVAKVKEIIGNGFNVVKEKIITPIASAFDKVKNTFSKIVSTIKDNLNKAKDAVKSIIDKIKGFFNFEFKMPKLKIPKFSISPSGWSVGDLLEGVIPKLTVSWNAKGGVFDKPTLMSYGGSLQGLGEDGAEAIVPLEKNTEWLDKMATMLAEKTGNKPVVIEVDGKVFGKTAISTINQNTKQTGKLQLIF